MTHPGLPGGIVPVPGAANDHEIITLAEFAVTSHNQNQHTILEFVRVVDARRQVVAGTMYYITLEARDGDEVKAYEAKVLEKEWENFKEVEEFRLLEVI